MALCVRAARVPAALRVLHGTSRETFTQKTRDITPFSMTVACSQGVFTRRSRRRTIEPPNVATDFASTSIYTSLPTSHVCPHTKAEVAFPTEDLLGFLPTGGQGGCGAPNHVAAAAVEQPLTSEALPTPCSAGLGLLGARIVSKRICGNQM